MLRIYGGLKITLTKTGTVHRPRMEDKWKTFWEKNVGVETKCVYKANKPAECWDLERF
jgi:hypothetical protein